MQSLPVLNVVLIWALLIVSSGPLLAQTSCQLPLPCQDTELTNKPALAITNTGNGRAGIFAIDDPLNNKPALEGRTNSTADNAVGVFGRVATSTPGDHSAGVRGVNNGAQGDVSSIRLGVWGQANASNGTGVLGQSNAGTGVNGVSETGTAIFGETTDPAGGIGVFGRSNARGVVGTLGLTSCAGTYGVGGCGADQGIGVLGNSNTRGVVGTLGPTSCAGTYGVGGCGADQGIGVLGNSNTRGVVGTLGPTSCAGTYGVGGCASTGFGTGVLGQADQGPGVMGDSQGIGVWGRSNTRGVVGTLGATSCAGSYGVGGCADNGDGVVGRSNTGRAGFFIGNVQITGSLTKGSGAFKIDHPRDPENKYLSHSFVESPDMLGLYTGNVVLDAHGEATVALPEWFEALNRDFRYQLTAIGAPAPSLYIAEEVAQQRFKIAGGQPGMKVSWQVTGTRHDPYAEQNRIPVEEWKPEAERGKYLHPVAYGKPADRGVHFVRPVDPPDASTQQSKVVGDGGR